MKSVSHPRHRPLIAVIILVIALTVLLILSAQTKNRALEIATPTLTLTPTLSATLTYDQALDAANQAIARNPLDSLAYFQRATLYAQHKSYDLAVADFTRAIQLNPTGAAIYFGRGMTYISIAYQQKTAAQQEQIAQQAVADLRTAQRLGYALPADVELAVGEIEGQLGSPATTYQAVS